MDKLAEAILDFILRNRLFANLTFGLLFSAVTTLIGGYFLSIFELTDKQPYINYTRKDYGTQLVVYFAATTISIALLGLWLTRGNKRDVLSPLRSKLKGEWVANFSSYKLKSELGDLERDIIFGEFSNECKIRVDPEDEKLNISIIIEETDVFNKTIIETKNITLRYNAQQSSMIIFDKFIFTPNSSYNYKLGNIAIPISMLCVLEFDATKPNIDRLVGYWYDVDNSVFEVLCKVADANQLDEVRRIRDDYRRTMKEPVEFRRKR